MTINNVGKKPALRHPLEKRADLEFWKHPPPIVTAEKKMEMMRRTEEAIASGKVPVLYL